MRAPRIRLSLRSILVIVAIFAVLLSIGVGLKRRQERFRGLAKFHFRQAGPPRVYGAFYEDYMSIYHMALSDKYEDAAQHPWLPVAPDPPIKQRW